MKNKNQLKKELKSNKRCKYPLQIIYYSDIIKTFIKLINHIYNKSHKPILVLGRNNFDIKLLTNSDKFNFNNDILIYKENPNIKMKYLTIHRSKGLEEENVIIINLTNKKTGFPNKISDDKVLKYVSCHKDNYPHSEERRLFYVAITRTKNTTYLLTPKVNESLFITEIRKNYKNKIKIVRKDKF